MRVKILKDFITKKGVLLSAGDTYELGNLQGHFYRGLLKNKFIEKLQGTNFENWEKNGIESKLAKVLIAPEDYVDGDKEYFTWEEAMEATKKLPDGWRLPTRSEWALIAEEFGQKEGELDADTIVKNLGLGRKGGKIANGYIYGAGERGYYWSSVVGGSSDAYNFVFGATTSFNPSLYNTRYYGMSIRCVKDLEGKDDDEN